MLGESILGFSRNVLRFWMRPAVLALEILKMLLFFRFLRGELRILTLLTIADREHLGHFFKAPACV